MIILFEKIFYRIKRILKLFYYKLKYGKRLKIGKNISFRKHFYIYIDKNAYLSIGDNCFFNNYCSIYCMSNIKIGNGNLFGENVKIYDHNHIFSENVLERNKFETNNITIGNYNWFGTNTIILNKANIGSNNVIGASVVVNQEISNNKLIKINSKSYVVKQIRKGR